MAAILFRPQYGNFNMCPAKTTYFKSHAVCIILVIYSAVSIYRGHFSSNISLLFIARQQRC